MSKIPEAVIEAASASEDDGQLGSLSAKARARRVVNALANNLPDSAVEKALDAWYPCDNWRARITAANIRRDMRAAISAALRKMAEE